MYRKAAIAEPTVNAENRSGAEVNAGPHMGAPEHTYVAQEESAERPSALSIRSAPLGPVYRIEEPAYRPPMNPLITGAQSMIKEILEDQARARLDESKRRRDPLKPMSVPEIMAEAQFFNIVQRNQARIAFQMMFCMDTLNPGTVVKPRAHRLLREEWTGPHYQW